MPSVAPSEDVDSAVRVVVTPAQSSYFAGETFSVTITFSNTHSSTPPEAGPSSSNSRPQHKRGAHSISSAPLARPPTSPGTPRMSALPPPSRPKRGDDLPTRKGLVGRARAPQSSENLPDLIEERRKKLLAKSLSVSIAPLELEEQLAVGTVATSAPHFQRSFNDVRRKRAFPVFT